MKNKLFLPGLLALQMFLAQGVMAQNAKSSSLLHENMTATPSVDIKKNTLGDKDISHLSLDQVQTCLLDAINNERQLLNIASGTDHYRMFHADSILTDVAQDYAKYLYETGRFGHGEADGNTPKTRVKKHIPQVDRQYAEISENLAQGQKSIDDIVRSRMQNISTHRLSIVSDAVTRVGIGYYKGTCVVIFGATYADMISDSLGYENMTASSSIEMHKTVMLDGINNYRDSLHLHALKNDSQLTTVAQQYAETIDRTEYFEHKDQHGHGPMKRVSLLFPNHDFVVIGENLSALDDVQITLKSRKGSPAHNGSIIRVNCSSIGIGYCNGYWVVLFGIKR